MDVKESIIYIDSYNILIFQYSKYIHFLLYVQRMFL